MHIYMRLLMSSILTPNDCAMREKKKPSFFLIWAAER